LREAFPRIDWVSGFVICLHLQCKNNNSPVFVKKGIAIFLLLSLTAPVFLGYAWLSFSRQEIRREISRKIKAGLGQHELVTLVFSRKQVVHELRWEKPWEFEYRGQMYDVVKADTAGEIITYRCFWDKKETAVSQRIRSLVTKAMGHDPRTQENTRRLVSFMQNLFLQDPNVWHPFISDNQMRYNPRRVPACLSPCYDPLIPPPKIS
jgi:hypothetical protein